MSRGEKCLYLVAAGFTSHAAKHKASSVAAKLFQEALRRAHVSPPGRRQQQQHADEVTAGVFSLFIWATGDALRRWPLDPEVSSAPFVATAQLEAVGMDSPAGVSAAQSLRTNTCTAFYF